MKQKICHIICAGSGSKLAIKPKKGDLVLVADGGYKKLKNTDVKVDFLIGDFDSLCDLPTFENIIRLPKEKDFTDTMYCVNEGIKAGCEVFNFYFASGGKRIDHTIANLQILIYLANHGKIGYIFSGSQVITAIKNTCLNFSEKASGFISIFASSDIAKGVKICGLKYEFKGDLKNEFSLGVSNEFCSKTSSIEVKSGILTIVFDKKCLKYTY